ncbi:biliverdin reductase A isoform X4 [Monodelphis domestica]|uniref:biliverdin reductase A isoform X4 n=1 Tax=Monodelphis domestica TaxID=13616 RepID=UPI0024E25E78|nr:biliverdin reductase A isoform X4 [Monodelphis domestica]
MSSSSSIFLSYTTHRPQRGPRLYLQIDVKSFLIIVDLSNSSALSERWLHTNPLLIVSVFFGLFIAIWQGLGDISVYISITGFPFSKLPFLLNLCPTSFQPVLPYYGFPYMPSPCLWSVLCYHMRKKDWGPCFMSSESLSVPVLFHLSTAAIPQTASFEGKGAAWFFGSICFHCKNSKKKFFFYCVTALFQLSVALPSTFPVTSTQPERMFGVVVVGVGRAGSVRIRDLQTPPPPADPLKLIGFVSRRELGNINEAKQISLQDALSSAEVDVAYICNENISHEEYIRKNLT